MRLNLYTAAAYAFLVHGIDALSISSATTGIENFDYMDEYEYDLAQTYSDLDKSSKKDGAKCTDMKRKPSVKKIDLKVKSPSLKKESSCNPIEIPKATRSCSACGKDPKLRRLRDAKTKSGGCGCDKKREDEEALIKGLRAKVQSNLWSNKASAHLKGVSVKPCIKDHDTIVDCVKSELSL